MRVNKCVLNRFGFTLKDLYIHGPNLTDDFSDLGMSADNNCRGRIDYENGAEYVFKVDRTFSDCNSLVSHNDSHVTYDNAIQGSTGMMFGNISRKV